MIDQACHAAAHLAGLHGLLRGARQTLLPLYLERLALFAAQRWRGGFATALAIVVVRCLFGTGCLGLHGSGAFTLALVGLLIAWYLFRYLFRPVYGWVLMLLYS